MVQNPKGGGLSSSFGGGGTQQLGTLIGLILLSNITFTQSDSISESKALDTEEIVVDPLPINTSEENNSED